MESLVEEDPTLPIDFDQTSNFAMFLDKAKYTEAQDSISESTLPIDPEPELIKNVKQEKKKRSYSTNDQPLERPVSRGTTMREQENVISELKKENFGLKMRIYYMEEKLHEVFDATTEDVVKKNIELKVTIEELKKNLNDKSDLLSKASLAMEQLSYERDKHIEKLHKEYQTEFSQSENQTSKKLLRKNEEISKLKKEIDNLNIRILKFSDETDGQSTENIQKQLQQCNDNGIEKLQEQLDKKEYELQSLHTEIQNNEDAWSIKLQDLEQDIKNKDRYIEKLDGVIRDKDLDLDKKDQELSSIRGDTLQHNQQRINDLCSKDRQIIEMNLQLKKQNLELKKLKIVLDEKDKDIVFFSNNKLQAEDELSKYKTDSQKELIVLKSGMNELESAMQAERKMQRQKHQDLKEQYKRELGYKDKLIKHLTCAINQKDKLIESLVKSFSESESEENHPIIKTLQLKLKENQKLAQELTDNHYNKLRSKDNEIAMLKQTILNKDNLLEEYNFKHAILNEKLKCAQISEEEAKSLLEESQHLIDQNAKMQKEYKEDSYDKMREKEAMISKLSGFLLISNQNGSNVEDTLEWKSNQGIDKTGSLIQELCDLKEEALNHANIKYQHLLSIVADKDLSIKNLRTALSNNQNEKQEVMKELNLQLISAEQELKNVNDSLLKLRVSQEEETEMYHDSLKQKDDAIEELVKNNQEKDCIINKLKGVNVRHRDSSSDNLGEINKLQQITNMLKEDSQMKDNQIQELLRKNKNLENKTSTVSEQVRQKVTATYKQKLHELEEEKGSLSKLLDEKDMLIKDLNENLKEHLTKHSDNKLPITERESFLLGELEELVKAAEKEKAKYNDLSDKLRNNKSIESQINLLNHELSEVEHLRKNLQQLLFKIIKKKPLTIPDDSGNALQQQNEELLSQVLHLQNETKKLKKQLDNNTSHGYVQSKSFENLLTEKEEENSSLRDDLVRCDFEAKQLNNKLDTMKTDFEQLIHDRDREIVIITERCDQLNESNELIRTQKETMQHDLMKYHMKLDMLSLQLKHYQSIDKQSRGEEEKQINESLNNKNNDRKLRKAELDLQYVNDNKKTDETMMSSKSDANNTILKEKNELMKNDLKGLCNVNDRLRRKIKEIKNAYDKLKSEKELAGNNVYEELQKAKKTVHDIEKDISRRQKITSELQRDVQKIEKKKILCEGVPEEYESFNTSNEFNRGQFEDFSQAFESQPNAIRQFQPDVKQQHSSDDLKRDEYGPFEEDYCKTKEKLEEAEFQLKTVIDKKDKAISRVKFLSKQLGVTDECYKCSHFENEIESLMQKKKYLKERLKESEQSIGHIKRQLSHALDECKEKDKRIDILTIRVAKLDDRIKLLSPHQKISHQHAKVSTEAFTQTIPCKNLPDKLTDYDNHSLLLSHIKEMQELRKQLEETNRNNNLLRQQLEDRLLQVEKDSSMINDPTMRVELIREKDNLRVALAEKEASINKMKIHINEMVNEKSIDKERITFLHKQVHQLNELSATLKLEMEVYNRLIQQLGLDSAKAVKDELGVEGKALNKNLLAGLLEEVRNLCKQLKHSIDVNNALRQKFEQELGRPVSVSPLPTQEFSQATRSLFGKENISPGDNVEQSSHGNTKYFVSPYETPIKYRGPTSPSTCMSDGEMQQTTLLHDACSLYGKSSDFNSLKQITWKNIGRIASIQKKFVSFSKKKDDSTLHMLLEDLNQVWKFSKEITRLLSTFVIQKDIQPKLIEENHQGWIDDFENSMKKRLLKTRDTLKATKENLQMKANLSHSSSNGDSYTNPH